MEFKYLIIFAVCTSVCFGDCIPDRLPESANSNNSSSSMLVGNARPINVSSDRVVQLIHFLNEYKYNVSAPNDNLLIVTCVKNATAQVVAGMKYVYNVILQKTTCLKSDVEFSSLAVPNLFGTLCQVQDNSTEIPAKFSIWTQAWKNFVKVTDLTNDQ